MEIIFGKRLKELREEIGWSQARLAKALKLEQPHISRWESGRAIPETQTVVSIAIILHTSTDYLLGLTDNNTSRSEEAATYNKKHA